MKTTIQKTALRLLLLVTFSTLLLSCNSDNDNNDTQQLYGETVRMYDGNVTNWIKTENDSPLELGITFDMEALNSLPTSAEEVFKLDISETAKALTTIDHIELNWAHEGHDPAGIYNLSHFDMHYYMISEQEVEETIDIPTMEFAPASDYFPANYIPGPPVPMNGKHWIDSSSPELNGGAFTQTFIYGSNNGEVTFFEPMITQAYLTSTTYFERELPSPAKVSRKGYYPTKMRIVKNNNNNKVSVILSHFLYRFAM